MNRHTTKTDTQLKCHDTTQVELQQEHAGTQDITQLKPIKADRQTEDPQDGVITGLRSKKQFSMGMSATAGTKLSGFNVTFHSLVQWLAAASCNEESLVEVAWELWGALTVCVTGRSRIASGS